MYVYRCSNRGIVTVSRKVRRVRHVASIEDKENAYRLFVGKAEQNRPLIVPWNLYAMNLDAFSLSPILATCLTRLTFREKLRKTRLRLEDNIKTDLTETKQNSTDCNHLVQDRDKQRELSNTVIKFLIPNHAVNFLTKWGTNIYQEGPNSTEPLNIRLRTDMLFKLSRNVVTAVLQIGRSLVRYQLVSLAFFIDIKFFRLHYGSGVDSDSNRNEYQEHFLGVKAAGA